MSSQISLEYAVKRLQNETWTQFDEMSRTPPKTIYHYTDSAGLEGILRDKVLWATHAAYLNDPHEVTYTYGVFQKELRRTAALEGGMQEEFFEYCERSLAIKSYYSPATEDAYCASFSAEKDDLSQYRAYSAQGEGYCIGFSTEKLKHNLATYTYGGADLFELVKMQYGQENLEKVIKNHILMAFHDAKDVVEGGKDKLYVYKALSSFCVQALVRLACYFKQPGFEQEREWRIIPGRFGAPGSRPLDQFAGVRRRGNLFIPHLELPLINSKGHLNTVTEIVIGPKLPFDKAHQGVVALLSAYNIENEDVLIDITRSRTALQ